MWLFMPNFVSAYTTTHSKEASAVVHHEYSPADTWEATAYSFLITTDAITWFPALWRGKRAPGIYCSHMRQIPMVTLLSYTIQITTK